MKWRKVTALFLVMITVFSLLSVTGCNNSVSSDKKEETEENIPNENTVNNEKGYYTAEDYLADPSLFQPVWADEWDVPEEMLDFDEKWESFFDPDGRLMSLIHRAGCEYYPENSIEAIMSCIAAGADMLELDLMVTKDRQFVLMHDQTITRTTNVKQLRESGAVGLPESDYVCDWTLEQLRRLRLVMEGEDGTSTVTNYVIPTFEEVLMVSAEHIFIFLDFAAHNYEFTWENDIYPLVKKYNAYRTIGFPAYFAAGMSMDRIKEVMSQMEKESGYPTLLQISVNETNIEPIIATIEANNWPRLLRLSAYSPVYDEMCADYLGKYRIHVNAIMTDYDNPADWKMIHEKGYNFIHTDYYIEMGKYIQELYFSK